jgi:hypothetical protein
MALDPSDGDFVRRVPRIFALLLRRRVVDILPPRRDGVG